LVPAIGQARCYASTPACRSQASRLGDIVRWEDTLGEAFGVGGRAEKLGIGTSNGYGPLYITKTRQRREHGYRDSDAVTKEGPAPTSRCRTRP